MPRADFKIVKGKREVWVYDATGQLSMIFTQSEARIANERVFFRRKQNGS